MIFLIFKIFVYLIVAAGIGGAAGWLLRNLQAQKTEEDANRAVNDAKSKLPQLESLLRGRDDQIKKLKEEISDTKSELANRSNEVKAVEQKLREQERKLGGSRKQGDASLTDIAEAGEVTGDHSSETDSLITELSQEITRLKEELAAHADDGREAEGNAADDLLVIEKDALEMQLKTAETKLERIQSDLRAEQDKVRELERERELQNKSIQVLHQQLEMERSRRAANG